MTKLHIDLKNKKSNDLSKEQVFGEINSMRDHLKEISHINKDIVEPEVENEEFFNNISEHTEYLNSTSSISATKTPEFNEIEEDITNDLMHNITKKMLSLNASIDNKIPPEEVVKEVVKEVVEEVVEEINEKATIPVKKRSNVKKVEIKPLRKRKLTNESVKPIINDKWGKLKDKKKETNRNTKKINEFNKSNSLTQNAITSNVATIIKDISEKDRKNQKELIEYIGDKMDNIADIIKNKPDSYKFDIKRDNLGYISTVLVKPNN